MKNIVLFGGAFDPVHNGHLNMALEASRQLDADVYFIPAKIAVWKNDSVSIDHKINMLKLAISGKKRLFIDEFEVNQRSDINYTIDTIKHFKEIYHNDNLYLLIGTDQVNKFHLWKNAEEISKLVKIVYFARPGFKVEEHNIQKYSITKLEGQELDISSSDIKDLKSLNLPVSVINYIVDNNLYFINKIKSYLTAERYNHSVEVAKLAYEIAEKNKLSIKYDCFIAGLLHDIGKNVKGQDAISIMKEHYSEYLDLPAPVYHQFIGHFLAKNDFNITNNDILNAIKFHTTGCSSMCDIAKIVYAADKIEPTRGFDSKWLIDAIEVNLNKGFSTILKDNIKYFETNNVPYKNKLMVGCFEKYILK